MQRGHQAIELPQKRVVLQFGNSQNFLHKFLIFFVTLGLKILRLLRQKVLFTKG